MDEQRTARPAGSHAGAGVSTPAGGVLALLVSHDGARWLPTVLAGLAEQDVAPDHVVAVDTGSDDASRDLLTQALGAEQVLAEPADTGFPDAVRRGLAHAPDTAWVWLLHDDSTPDPGALAALLEAAAADPGADVLGPKLREWPSLKRLLEVGLTISGTGRRETGLEPGEYDQGQHDELRDVLAVNTAGMLVRRTVLDELGGFDDALPVFGTDLDFGWRVARAGHRTVVVPQAVVFHAEAARRGLRSTAQTGGARPRVAERSAALHTVLANSTGALYPLQWLRLLGGSVLRMLGFLAVRAPGEAADELAAVVAVHGHPGRLREARAWRASLGPNDARVRRLLAPRWLPYRRGLDAVSDLAAAATLEASDVAERRRTARDAEALARGERVRRPTPAGDADEDVPYADSGLVVRFVTDPVALVLTAFVLALLWVTHQGFDGGGLSAAGLSPAPAHVSDWWRLYAEAHHPLGQGSDAPAPAYLLPLALLGTLLLGHAGGAVGLVLVASCPVATWGAWRLLRLLGRLLAVRAGAPASRWVRVWGAATYGLLPVVSGAWGQGRLGPVVATAVLPWLAHAAVGFGDPVADRRWRAGWRVALLLAVAVAFAPVLLLYAVALTVVALVVLVVRGAATDRSVWLPLLVPVVAPLVLLVPWTLPTLLDGRSSAFLLGAGRLPSALVDGTGAAAGRLADGSVDGSAPLWSGLLLAGAAVAALAVPRVRPAALVAWVAALVAALVLAGLDGVRVHLPVGEARPAVDVLVPVLGGCAVVAVAAGLQRLGRQRLLGAALVLAAAVVPVAGLVWAFGDTTPLDRDADPGIPAYMTQNAALAADRGVLVVSGSVDTGLDYRVVRGAQVTLGQDEIVAATPTDPALTTATAALLSRPSADTVERLARFGVAYVVLSDPADGRVSSRLDATSGLEVASAADPQTRAWQLQTPPSATAPGTDLDGHGSALRTLLLAVQAVALLVVLVLCGPARREATR